MQLQPSSPSEPVGDHIEWRNGSKTPNNQSSEYISGQADQNWNEGIHQRGEEDA